MLLQSNENFNKIADATGNRYAAIKQIVAAARHKEALTHYNISSSEAITWVVDNKKPKSVITGQAFQPRTTYVDDILNEYLTEIDDNLIKQSVKNSVNYTYSNGHLVYSYNDTLNEYEKSRVRVITRMIWDEIRKKGNM